MRGLIFSLTLAAASGAVKGSGGLLKTAYLSKQAY
jgi:hypothetical protein